MKDGRSVIRSSAPTKAVSVRDHGTELVIRNDTLAVVPPHPIPLRLQPRRIIGRTTFYVCLALIFALVGYGYRDPGVRKALDYQTTLAFSSGISTIPPVLAGKIAPPQALPSHASYLFIDGQKGPRADKFLIDRRATMRERKADEPETLGIARRTKTASLNLNAADELPAPSHASLADATLFLTAVAQPKAQHPAFADVAESSARPTGEGKSEWAGLLKNASLSPEHTGSSTLFGGLTEDEFRLRELRCMATAIYFEARDEPVKGQIAVGQVVMNRVRSQFYPKTICGVIYQGERLRTGCQFSFTCTGKKLRVREKPEWANSVRIAKQVIAREVWLDEIGYATHYHATYVKPTWRHELDKVAKIGEHIFYKMKPGKIQVALLAEGL